MARKRKSHHEMHSLNKEPLRDRVLQKRRELISALEEKRGSRVITLVHRREPWLEGEQSISTP